MPEAPEAMSSSAQSPAHPQRLRVLVVSPYFPFPPSTGISMRIYQLLRQIAARHDLTLLTNSWPEDRADFSALSALMPVHAVDRRPPTRLGKRFGQLRSIVSPLPFACRVLCSDELQQSLDQLCATQRFDLIHIESSTMCSLRVPDGIPVVVDEHNLEYELYGRLYRGERSALRRAFNWVEYRRFRTFEEECWRRVQGCAVTSQREEPVVRSVAPDVKTAVIPNSVDLEYFRPSSESEAPDTVVFNGILEYRPNLDGAAHLVDDIWPRVLSKRPAARLRIVGRAGHRDATRLRRPTVEVTGRVDDIRPHVHDAAVVVVPIRMGGGTRLKVVEAMAMGKAIVSTSIGCEGIDVRDREHLLIADDPDLFAANIVELFDDAALRARLGAAGRGLAQARYSWDLAGQALEDLYGRVLAERAGRRPTSVGTETVGV